MRVIERTIHQDTQAGDGAAMVRLTLDLEELEDYPTDALPGFADQLLAMLPGLEEHACAPGESRSVGSILHSGMGVGHLVEHVALELQVLAGLALQHGETCAVDGHPGVYRLTLPCTDEALTLTASRMALELVASILPPDHRPVLGLGLLSAPIETSDADGSVPGLAALRHMVADENWAVPAAAPMMIDIATLDLLASVDLLAPVASVASVASVS